MPQRVPWANSRPALTPRATATELTPTSWLVCYNSKEYPVSSSRGCWTIRHDGEVVHTIPFGDYGKENAIDWIEENL